MICRFFRKLKLDHRPLTSQWSFWLAVGAPIALFFFFGGFSWIGKDFQFNQKGFDEFIRISKLPLGLLATIIPSVAVVSSMHRSIQTAEQIKHAEEKKNEEDESLVSEAAEECLKKAYELISDSHEKVIKNPILWKNSANLIGEFRKKKERLKIPTIVERLEVEEDYWRAKFESLLGTLKDEQDVREIRAHPAIIFLVAEFSVWRAERQDTAPYTTTKKEFADTLKKLKGNHAIQDYLRSNENVLVRQVSFMIMQPMTDLQSPDKEIEEAIRSGDMSDPVVVELRQQREASLNGKND